MKYISCQSTDKHSCWMQNVMAESFKEVGVNMSDVIVLLYTPNDRLGEDLSHWDYVKSLYPEVTYYHYSDTSGECLGYKTIYHNAWRFWILSKHWEAYPEMNKQVFLFTDNDIILTKPLEIDHLLEDDTIYWSDCTSYLSHEYFKSKEKDVLPEKLAKYQTRDIFQECLHIVDKNLSKESVSQYDFSTGGCQILYKNREKAFWDKCLQDIIQIKGYLDYVNRQFFLNGNKGFQSFCSDMFSPAWNLWSEGIETKCAKELHFAWSTDPKSVHEISSITHNAGVSPNQGFFYKGKMEYVNNIKTPFEDMEYIEEVLNNPNTQKFCNHTYAEYIKKVYNKYYA